MTRKMIRYEVRPEDAGQNEELVRGVFEELHALGLEGLSYEAFALDDGVGFIHIVEHPDGNNPLPELPAFKRYIADVRERCAEPPTFAELRTLGSVSG
jgi:hypothetical protein